MPLSCTTPFVFHLCLFDQYLTCRFRARRSPISMLCAHMPYCTDTSVPFLLLQREMTSIYCCPAPPPPRPARPLIFVLFLVIIFASFLDTSSLSYSMSLCPRSPLPTVAFANGHLCRGSTFCVVPLDRTVSYSSNTTFVFPLLLSPVVLLFTANCAPPVPLPWPMAVALLESFCSSFLRP